VSGGEWFIGELVVISRSCVVLWLVCCCCVGLGPNTNTCQEVVSLILVVAGLLRYLIGVVVFVIFLVDGVGVLCVQIRGSQSRDLDVPLFLF